MVNDYGDSDLSEFNMAFAYLYRIDKLLYRCQESAMIQNIDAWLNALRGVYRELSVKLKPDEIADIEKDFKEIYVLINNRTLRVTNKLKILFMIDQLEIKVRAKLQLKGMLLPSKENSAFAVLKR